MITPYTDHKRCPKCGVVRWLHDQQCQQITVPPDQIGNVNELPEHIKLGSPDVKERRLERRIKQRDRRIEGLMRKISQLEAALSWRLLDTERISRNIGKEVQQALCNVRMIPVHPKYHDKQIVAEFREAPTETKIP